MGASIDTLQKELETLVKGVTAFSASGFSSFDIDDLAAQAEGQGLIFPVAGVMYAGCAPVEKIQGANGASPVAISAHAASIVTMQFTVVIAIQYHYGGQDDTKPQATSLLDDLRNRIMGYKGVNNRPWQFAGEKPEPAASGDGIAFYSQVWQTGVSAVGKT
jgi:hypothetical protein